MKASERWLRERADTEGASDEEMAACLVALRDRYAIQVLCLDAAERRLQQCSETAQEHASRVIVSSLGWHHEVWRLEAMAAVAEDVDRRAPFLAAPDEPEGER